MVIVLLCVIVMFCAVLLAGFQMGVSENVKMKCPADLPSRGMLFMSRTPVRGGGASSPLSHDFLEKPRERIDKPASQSQISSPDLQSGDNGSTIDAEAEGLPHQDPVPSELNSEEEYLPGPNSIFTVKSSKSDPLAKQIFSLKRVDAFLIQQLVPEYATYSVDEIVKLAINPIAADTGFGETEHFSASQVEITSPDGAVVRADVRFFAKHAPKPKRKIKRKAKKKRRSTRKGKKKTAGKSQRNQKINPLDILIVHVEAQNADALDQVILNRSDLISAADLFGQLEPSGNQYRKYRDVSDVLVIWVLFSADPHQQNRVLNRKSNMNIVYENDYHLLREANDGHSKSDESKSSKGDNKDSGGLGSDAKKLREEIGNGSWPYKTRMKESLVTEWFVILGDPNNDSVDKHCPLLHALDAIFWEDVDTNEKLRILGHYDIVKSEKGVNGVSYSVTGSPFLIPVGDLQRAIASRDQKIANLENALDAANKKIARLEQASAESKKT